VAAFNRNTGQHQLALFVLKETYAMSDTLIQSHVVRLMVISASAVAVLAGMHAIASILNPIFVAALFAVLFSIPMSWLKKRGMAAGPALGVTLLVVLLVVAVFVMLMGQTLLNLNANLPQYQEQLQMQLQALGDMLTQAGIPVEQLRTVADSDASNPLGVIRYVIAGVGSILASALLIFVYAVFLLIEASSFPGKLSQAFNPSEPAYVYIRKVTSSLNSFLVAQTTVGLITGVGVWVMLWALGVEFAFLWGFVAFLLNFIPYIGSILAAVPPVIIAFIQYGPGTTVLLVIVGFLLVNLVVNYGIYPRMMGQSVDLSMFIVLAGMVFWAFILGPIGMILSVPLTAVIKISLESYAGSRWLAVLLGSGADTGEAK
jgi:predicted PurR-regulated permease PerM